MSFKLPSTYHAEFKFPLEARNTRENYIQIVDSEGRLLGYAFKMIKPVMDTFQAKSEKKTVTENGNVIDYEDTTIPLQIRKPTFEDGSVRHLWFTTDDMRAFSAAFYIRYGVERCYKIERIAYPRMPVHGQLPMPAARISPTRARTRAKIRLRCSSCLPVGFSSGTINMSKGSSVNVREDTIQGQLEKLEEIRKARAKAKGRAHQKEPYTKEEEKLHEYLLGRLNDRDERVKSAQTF